jgi:hypothetical protein
MDTRTVNHLGMIEAAASMAPIHERPMNGTPTRPPAADAVYWLNEVEKMQGGANGLTIKLRAAIAALGEPVSATLEQADEPAFTAQQAADAEKQMSNSDLQEAITMANAMAKGTGKYSPTYPAIRAHLETLLRVQQARAAWVYCGAEAKGQ